MRRAYIFLAFYLFQSLYARSQWEYFGSSTDLKEQLQKAEYDTTRLRLYVRLSNFYVFSNPDTAMQYAQEGLELAQSINNQKWIAFNNLCIGQCFLVIGNFPKGIEIGLKEISVCEQLNDTVGIIVGNFLASWGYRDENEDAKAIVYAKNALYYGKSIGDKSLIEIAYEHLASEFKGLYQLDSALAYAKAGLKYKSLNFGQAEWAGDVRTLADIFDEMKQYDSSLYYYRMSIGPSLKLGVLVDAFDSYLGIAKVHQHTGQLDSSIFYANKAWSEFPSLQYPAGKLLATSLLADNYQSYKKNDSALKYLRLSLLIKDSLYSQEKLKALQNISFNEQLRRQEIQQQRAQFRNRMGAYILASGLVILLVVAGLLYRNNLQKRKANQKIKKAYTELKATQAQLIQSEKMASLGELTAGIAHEIQNPLNFVNNFSEVNNELIEELRAEASTLKAEEQNELLNDIFQNNEKISIHGKRADAIVKGMLQHSRTSSAVKTLTEINALCGEYLRLSYHGMRAKGKNFTADLEMELDETIGQINIVPQDIGRVLLNLYNNAFYAVSDRASSTTDITYKPMVSVQTKKINDKVQITVSDNGNGIPQHLVDKIFQPFFTTKPTGQGTGLGLSISYDIIKAHGGELKVESKVKEGSEFIIQLPLQDNS